MTWSQGKTDLEAELQAEDNASEIEIDGHRVRKRTVDEMVQMEDFMDGKAQEETEGTPNLKRAGMKVQAKNNGSGLV
mgnify:CR=1 FL=1